VLRNRNWYSVWSRPQSARGTVSISVGNRLKAFFLTVLTLALGSIVALAEPSKPPVPEDEIINRYLQATQQQQTVLRGATEEVDIAAAVPKFKKQGKLHALRNISKLGKITYHALGFIGDNVVKTEVIANYLKAEIESSQNPTSNVAITPVNYKFKYKGMEDWNGRTVYVMHVNPRHKRVGLFKGELWLDAETYMPVRESGSFVKSPSFLLKKMQFVREYGLQNGVSIPQRTESRVETRFFGPVELNVDYLAVSQDSSDAVGTTAADQQ
jgi:hypothetical protein